MGTHLPPAGGTPGYTSMCKGMLPAPLLFHLKAGRDMGCVDRKRFLPHGAL